MPQMAKQEMIVEKRSESGSQDFKMKALG